MSNKQYVLGRGKVYFDPYAPGTKNTTGERYLGNTPSFGITIASTSLDHFDSDAGIKTKDDSITLELTRTGAFVTDNIDPQNVALFLLGSTSTKAQTAATAVVSNIPNVSQDRFYQLGVVPITNPSGVRGVASVVVKDDTTPTAVTFDLNTDYTVDLDLGRIYIVPGGDIDDGTNLVVTFNTLLKSRSQIITASNATVEGAMRFVATNPKGPLVDYYMPYLRMSPNGEFQLKGDAWQQLSFNLEVLTKDDSTASIYADGRPYTPS